MKRKPSISRPENDPNIELLLMGGVGNQLFQFFAGVYLAELKKSRLILNTCRLSEVRHQGSNILNCEYLRKYYQGTSTEEINVPGRLSLDTWRLGRILKHKILGKSLTYTSKVLGSDRNFEGLPSNIKLHGYFQTIKYVQSLESKAIFNRFEFLKSISTPRVKNLVREILEIDPVIIHVRRGDYSQLSRTLGLLNADYYDRAISALLSHRLNSREIWVLSDDFSIVRQEFSELIWNFRYLEETVDWKPLELIGLMSSSSTLVMANSTLSWWGAFFSDSATQVIAPEKWFKSIAAPQDLYSNSWVMLGSSWG